MGTKASAVMIRGLLQKDAQAFSEAFAAQGWHKPAAHFLAYLDEQRQGQRQVFVADVAGQPVGYVCLLPEAPAGPYQGKGIPCLQDFNVLQAYQGQGIGSKLLDAAEAEAFSASPAICLGVGLHSGYGAAQRLYVKRGYVPDGSGLWYQDKPLAQRGPCYNDDDLVLYMLKTKVKPVNRIE